MAAHLHPKRSPHSLQHGGNDLYFLCPRSKRCLEGTDIIIHYRSLVFVHHFDLEIGMLGHVLTFQISFHTGHKVLGWTVDLRIRENQDIITSGTAHDLQQQTPMHKDSHKRNGVVDLRNEIRVTRADEVHLGETRGADELNGHIDELAAIRQKNLVHDALRLVFHRRRCAVNEARHSC